MIGDNETGYHGLNWTEEASVAEAAASTAEEYEESFFKYLVEGFLMPLISLFGFVGNLLSMYILR